MSLISLFLIYSLFLCRSHSVTWNPHKLMGSILQCSTIHFKEDVSKYLNLISCANFFVLFKNKINSSFPDLKTYPTYLQVNALKINFNTICCKLNIKLVTVACLRLYTAENFHVGEKMENLIKNFFFFFRVCFLVVTKCRLSI